jgi:hypothetical protein
VGFIHIYCCFVLNIKTELCIQCDSFFYEGPYGFYDDFLRLGFVGPLFFLYHRDFQE